jgi:hypothetical protein
MRWADNASVTGRVSSPFYAVRFYTLGQTGQKAADESGRKAEAISTKRGQKKGRGKEAGPALKSPIGILGSLPSDAGIHGTPKTKVNLLKLNDPDRESRVKNPQAPQKIPPRQVVLAACSTSGHYNLFLEENPD